MISIWLDVPNVLILLGKVGTYVCQRGSFNLLVDKRIMLCYLVESCSVDVLIGRIGRYTIYIWIRDEWIMQRFCPSHCIWIGYLGLLPIVLMNFALFYRKICDLSCFNRSFWLIFFVKSQNLLITSTLLLIKIGSF